MPRELSHYFIALEALKGSPSAALLDIDTTFRSTLFLGANVHDIGFYNITPPFYAEQYSVRIHCKDTLALPRYLWEHRKNFTLPFVLGVVSHIVTDTCFHPLVNHFSGDYYDENLASRNNAKILHRKLEAILESSIINQAHFSKSEQLFSWHIQHINIKEISVTLNQFTRSLGFDLNTYKLIKQHALLQRIFRSNNSFLKLITPKSIQVMFLDLNEKTDEILNKHASNEFTQPHTLIKKLDTPSLNGLIEPTIEVLASIFEKSIYAYQNNNDFDSLDFKEYSLDTGRLVSDDVDQAYNPLINLL